MRTRSKASVRVREGVAILAMGLSALLTGCGETRGGSGPDEPHASGSSHNLPGDTASSPDPGGAAGTDGSHEVSGGNDEEPVVYEWGLPSSDTSVGEEHQGAEDSAYRALQLSCSDAAAFLDSTFGPEYGFESPRNVLLFAAGVQLCEGNRDEAAVFFEHAQALGIEGLTPDTWSFCVLYKVVRSVLEQQPPEDFQCAGGTAPPFTVGDNELTDDPLTLDEDESITVDGTDSGGDIETGTKPDPTPSPATSTEP